MATISGFAERLIELRENKGKKRQEVADDINISRASLEYYEKGKRNPDIEILEILADYYNVTCDYLIKGVKTENVSINEVTGLSDKAIDNLKLYQQLKKSMLRRFSYFKNRSTNENDTKYSQKVKNTFDIDIISYFIEHINEYEILSLLESLITVIFDETNSLDIEEEIIESDSVLYNKIYTHGTVLIGYDYKRFLEQEITREFSNMVRDFSVERNPIFKDEDIIFKYGHESYPLSTMGKDDELLTDSCINGGEINGNNTQTK